MNVCPDLRSRGNVQSLRHVEKGKTGKASGKGQVLGRVNIIGSCRDQLEVENEGYEQQDRRVTDFTIKAVKAFRFIFVKFPSSQLSKE